MSLVVSAEQVQLSLPSGSSVSVALIGATVYSWKTGDGKERLFKSSKSPISGPAAIRGGIPICWPVFGPPPSAEDDKDALYQKLKQHGFARIDTWTFEDGSSEPTNGKLVFSLKPSPLSTPLFTKDFALTYVVVLTDSTLTTSLTVKNPSSSDILPFQALLHTYLALPEGVTPKQAKVLNLTGLQFDDKAAGHVKGTESRVEVDFFAGEVDRVYSSVPNEVTVKYSDAEGGYLITKANLPDTTVWNPGEKGNSIGDMEQGGVDKYICIEPGHVSEFYKLEPGKTWIGSQTIKALL